MTTTTEKKERITLFRVSLRVEMSTSWACPGRADMFCGRVLAGEPRLLLAAVESFSDPGLQNVQYNQDDVINLVECWPN